MARKFVADGWNGEGVFCLYFHLTTLDCSLCDTNYPAFLIDDSGQPCLIFEEPVVIPGGNFKSEKAFSKGPEYSLQHSIVHIKTTAVRLLGGFYPHVVCDITKGKNSIHNCAKGLQLAAFCACSPLILSDRERTAVSLIPSCGEGHLCFSRLQKLPSNRASISPHAGKVLWHGLLIFEGRPEGRGDCLFHKV